MSPAVRPWVVVLTLLLGALLITGPAAAQAPGQEQESPDVTEPTGTLTIEDFTGVLLPGQDFRLRVRVRNLDRTEMDDLRIVTTLHRRATSRLDFQRAVDAGRVGITIHPFAVNVDPLGPLRSAVLDVEQTAAEMGFANPVDKYGVYPLRVQLQRFGEVLDETVTSVVLAPPTDQVERPVRTALLVPLDAPPARLHDGTFHGSRILPALGTGGRLQVLVESVAARPQIGLTVATSGLLLDQVADLADGFDLGADGAEQTGETPGARQSDRFLERLTDVLANDVVEHVALPYGPADLVALTRGALAADATRSISEGRAIAEHHTGSAPTSGVLWPPDGMDRTTLGQALGAGVSSVVLSERYLAIADDRELPYSPSPVRRLRTPAGSTVTALVPDPWLEELFARDGDGESLAVAAQRVLADTAAVYFERPYAAQTRGLLLAPPQVWEPPRGLVAALLDGFGQATWLEPVGVSGLRAAVTAEAEAVQLDYPQNARSRELPDGYIAELRDARRALSSLSGVLAEEDATPDMFDTMLAAATSVHYRNRSLLAEGRELIRTVNATVSDLYGSVAIVDGPPVILSSIEGQVPITVRNDAEVPLRVRLRLETQLYEFENGAVTEAFSVEGGETLTRAFQVRALAPGGTHQIRVVVEDGDGGLALAHGTVVVRSTAVSLTALLVTIGAGVFLAGWWIRETSRRRHARRVATDELRTAA